MTTTEAFQFVKNQIESIYDESEADNIAELIIEHITIEKKFDRIIQKGKEFSAGDEVQLNQYITRLQKHEPVQYILNESWFYGLKFYVDKHVLIPRPETEELVDWALKETKKSKVPKDRNLKILDIGTGSGCIAVSLKRNLPPAFEVLACDINEEALTISRKNADYAGVFIDFIGLDFLDEKQREQLPAVDIIISNPPYVPLNDKKKMKENVVNYEPHTALFVPDNDPLIFYKAIANFGKEHLNDGGTVFVELHEDLSNSVIELFKSNGYPATELRKDMQGKDRMLKAES